MTFAIGWIWGLVLVSASTIINQNYDAFKAFAEAGNSTITSAIIAFILGSLLILVVMLCSGLLQTLAGRRMRGRWLTLIGVGVGGACASLTLQYAPVVI